MVRAHLLIVTCIWNKFHHFSLWWNFISHSATSYHTFWVSSVSFQWLLNLNGILAKTKELGEKHCLISQFKCRRDSHKLTHMNNSSILATLMNNQMKCFIQKYENEKCDNHLNFSITINHDLVSFFSHEKIFKWQRIYLHIHFSNNFLVVSLKSV